MVHATGRPARLDPADPGFSADPYPVYEAVRESTAVWQQPDDRHYYLTRYDEVHAAFRDRRLGTSFLHRYTPEEFELPPGIPVWRDPRWTGFQAFERWELLNLEPPAHTRIRRLVTSAFTPRAIERLRDDVRERARRLLAPGRESGSLDLVGSYAQHFSLGIICDLIGVSPGDRQTILALSDAIIRMYEPAPTEAEQAEADRSASVFREYLLEVVARRRREPVDDLLTALVGARYGDEALTDDQIVATAMVLLMAGHEAVVNATSNGLAALAADPDQWALLRAGEIAVRDAIEELLRWDPPLQWFERWVLDDGVEIAGTPIPKASRVALVLASANRDPRRYPEPDRLDLRRADPGHLSLGGGIHFCIGAPLARLELETTLTELLETEPELIVLPGATRRPTFQFRGYERLEVVLHPRSDVH